MSQATLERSGATATGASRRLSGLARPRGGLRLFPVRSMLMLALRRLWAYSTLILCLELGLIAAVAVVSSIPFYAEAAQASILQDVVGNKDDSITRPPFAFMYRYIGAWSGPNNWQQYQAVDDYMRNNAPT